MTRRLTFDEITARPTRAIVHVDAWNGAVEIAKLCAADKFAVVVAAERAKARTSTEHECLSDSAEDSERRLDQFLEGQEFLVLLSSKSIVDPDGSRKFDSAAGREFLATETAAVLEIAAAAMRLNGLGSLDPPGDSPPDPL